MPLATLSPEEFAQRLAIIRRHLNGLSMAIDALEHEMQQASAPRPPGERAAQRASDRARLPGWSEIKDLIQ